MPWALRRYQCTLCSPCGCLIIHTLYLWKFYGLISGEPVSLMRFDWLYGPVSHENALRRAAQSFALSENISVGCLNCGCRDAARPLISTSQVHQGDGGKAGQLFLHLSRFVPFSLDCFLFSPSAYSAFLMKLESVRGSGPRRRNLPAYYQLFHMPRSAELSASCRILCLCWSD